VVQILKLLIMQSAVN